MAHVVHAPGRWVAVSAPGGWLLADVDPDDPIVLSVWSLLRHDAPVTDVADALLANGLSKLRGFALVKRREDGAGIAIARGDGSVLVGGEAVVRGSDAATWREAPLPPGGEDIVLSAGNAGVGDLPLADGVTLASSVRVVIRETAAMPPAAPPMPAAPPFPPPAAYEPAPFEPAPLEPPPLKLPWGPEPAAPEPESTQAVAMADLLDEHPAGAAPAAPTVQAVRCDQGHYNPLTTGICRVCGIPLQAQQPVSIPRPPLGVLKFSTGEVVTLDRPILMGRNPSSEAEDVQVVRLNSPNHDISRNHAEVALDGWHVLVTDLNSMNGTSVTPPWQPEAQRLRPNEAQPIEPGTVVSLADEVTFRYEVA